MKTIDLNCDVGEGAGVEASLLPLVSSANIACGAHAGDDAMMASTMRLAAANPVGVGAHPGFEDRKGFGRREIRLPANELRQLVLGQLEALARHGEFHYVKPHGALYNMAAKEEAVAATVIAAIKEFSPSLWVLGLAGSKFLEVAQKEGLRPVAEAFADRRYDVAGHLVSRGEAGAVIESEAAAIEQVLDLVREGRVRSVTGEWVELQAESICLHGDNPQAVQFAQRLRGVFQREAIEVKPFKPLP